MNILLQILDDGRLTDNLGRTVSFKNTVVIMTSNVGAKLISSKRKLGFLGEQTVSKEYEELKKDVLNEVKLNFRPEFLNRIDEIIVFQKLNKDEMKEIVNIMLDKVSDRMEKQNIKINFENSINDLIVKNLQDDNFGARPIRRLIQNLVEDRIVDEYLDGNIKENSIITAFVEGEDVRFRV